MGMKFESAPESTTTVKNYGVCNGFNIRFMRSGLGRLRFSVTESACGGYTLVLMG